MPGYGVSSYADRGRMSGMYQCDCSISTSVVKHSLCGVWLDPEPFNVVSKEVLDLVNNGLDPSRTIQGAWTAFDDQCPAIKSRDGILLEFLVLCHVYLSIAEGLIYQHR